MITEVGATFELYHMEDPRVWDNSPPPGYEHDSGQQYFADASIELSAGSVLNDPNIVRSGQSAVCSVSIRAGYVGVGLGLGSSSARWNAVDGTAGWLGHYEQSGGTINYGPMCDLGGFFTRPDGLPARYADGTAWAKARHTARITFSETLTSIYLDGVLLGTEPITAVNPYYGSTTWTIRGYVHMYEFWVNYDNAESRRWLWRSPSELLDFQGVPGLLDTSGPVYLAWPPVGTYPVFYYPKETNQAAMNLAQGFISTPWYNAFGSGTFGSVPQVEEYATTDATYRTKRVYTTGSAVRFQRCEVVDDPATWSDPALFHRLGGITIVQDPNIFLGARSTTIYARPCLVTYPNGVLTAWFMERWQLQGWLSTDDGRTWAQLGANMLGNSLRNLHAVQYQGRTLAVGIRAGYCYAVRSEDQGRTQASIPNSGLTESVIGPCFFDTRPCVTWYPNGEVAVRFAGPDGYPVLYTSSYSGYDHWTLIP